MKVGTGFAGGFQPLHLRQGVCHGCGLAGRLRRKACGASAGGRCGLARLLGILLGIQWLALQCGQKYQRGNSV